MLEVKFKNYRIYYNFLNSLAKDLTKFYFKKLDKPFKTTNKLKGKGYDPVTTSDKEFEKFIRLKISRRFPNHQIIGEELVSKEIKAIFLGLLTQLTEQDPMLLEIQHGVI